MKPTYLYIKTHNKTGLKYFGKTCNKDPYKYQGSGTYWKNHLRVHGYDCTTEIIGYFEDEAQCKQVALQFSIDNDIVASSQWANLKFETLDGGWDHITIEHNMKGIATFRARPLHEQKQSNAKKARHGKDNYWYGKNRSGENNPRYGTILPDTQKEQQASKMQGMYTYYDANNLPIRVATTDPRVISGELKPKSTGLVTVRNLEGLTFTVSNKDPRFLSGELVSVNKGKKRTDEEKQLLSNHMSQLRWFNNGEKTVRVLICPGEGWTPGKIKKKNN